MTRGERGAAAAILLLAAALRIGLAWTDQGVYWPDEIYQSLEQAHRLVFGYGIVPWEFAEGARSWLFPALFAALWFAMDLAGAVDAATFVIAAKLLMVAISVAGIYAAMRIAAHFGGAPAALLAGLLLLAFPPLLLLGARALSEVASATLVTFAVLLALRAGSRDLALAGVLAALACFLRFQNGLIAIGLAALVLAQGRWSGLRPFLLGTTLTALLGGLLDWATWGSPFHSLRAYLQYNLIDGQAAKYGEEGATYYARVAWTSTGPVLLAILAGWALALRRAAGVFAVCALYVAAHVAVAHKEYRFLLPVVPVLVALAAAGLALAFARGGHYARLLPVVGILFAAALARHAQQLTFDQLGQYRGQPAAAYSPWSFNDGVNRLLWEVGRLDDACGVWLGGVRPAWTGGFSYLHRDIPLVWGDEPHLLLHANYFLSPPVDLPMPVAPWVDEVEVPPSYHPAMRAGGWTLHRRDGGCVAPTHDDRRFHG